MSKPKILLLCSRTMGRQALEFLLTRNDIELVGVVESEEKRLKYWSSDIQSLAGGLYLTQDPHTMDLDFDLLVSVKYTKLVKEPLLSRPGLGCVNIHNSHNLHIRGRNCTSHAILLAREENNWQHGQTLHYMAAALDSGPIIATITSPIYEDDTALTLFQRTEDIGFQFLTKWLPKVWSSPVATYQPPDGFHSFRKDSLSNKELNQVWAPLKQYDFVRALTFPPFERPYILSNGQKIYLTIDPKEGMKPYLQIDSTKSIYYLGTSNG